MGSIRSRELLDYRVKAQCCILKEEVSVNIRPTDVKTLNLSVKFRLAVLYSIVARHMQSLSHSLL